MALDFPLTDGLDHHVMPICKWQQRPLRHSILAQLPHVGLSPILSAYRLPAFGSCQRA